MLDWLKARITASPEALALIYDEKRWTYADLDQEVDNLAGALIQSGITQGEHIAVLLDASPQYVALIFALMRIQAVLVPLNTRLTPSEWAWQVEQADITTLIFSSAYKEAASGLPVEYSLNIAHLPDGVPNGGVAQPELDLDALQAIVFTSGTTSSPKGVMLTYGNHYASAMSSAYRIGVQPDDLWLSCLPLHHVGGLAVFFRSCLYGTGVLLHNRFEAKRVSKALDELPITMISVVPTMLYRLLEHRQQWELPALRCVLLGGAAAQPELIERAFAHNLPIHTTYGLTEASSQVATMLPHDVRQKPGSVGKGLLFTAVDVINDSGNSAAAGEFGEVVVSGPTVMQGYYNNSEATQRTLLNGTLHTGDIGYKDADGDLFVLQRRSDLIISGGENVLPSEVEAVLKAYPAVDDVVVVGVDDIEWGQKVAALVITSTRITAEDLQAYARQHLAGPKRPRVIAFTDHFPRTASGKVKRAAVREMFDAID